MSEIARRMTNGIPTIALVAPDIKPVETCGSCEHFRSIKGVTYCGAHPPTVHVVMTPQGPGYLDQYPTVRETSPRCGEYRKRGSVLAP